MKLYAVFFGVDHEGERLDGVFSSQEKAVEQVELSKIAHGGRRHDEWCWVERYGDHQWELRDLYLRIAEIELDKKAYEHLSD
jgi:hypothetical protein